MDFLLFPGGVVGICFMLFLYLRKQQPTQRAIRVAKAHLTPAEDIEHGFKAVESSVKALRAAKNEEQALLVKNWEQQFYGPEEYDKRQRERNNRLQSAGLITASYLSAPKSTQYEVNPIVEDGPDWKPLTAPKRAESGELSYTQRRIQRAGAFVRVSPDDQSAVYGVAEGGDVVRFDGYVHGKAINGNDIWFVLIGQQSGLPKYVHSIATTDRRTNGLPDMTEYDTETVMNASGEICATYKTRPTGGITMNANYIQLPNATIKSRQDENLKYDPVPKEYIPSTLRKTKF